MRLLLDTHALLWWFLEDAALPRAARLAISDADEVWVSAISGFEVATKFRIGKLPKAVNLAMNFEQVVAAEGFQTLPVTLPHALAAGQLEIAHKDPFDRVLIAQSILEDLPLVTNERIFESFGVSRLW